jgi:alcohol dehydrogenase (cytochrome c)
VLFDQTYNGQMRKGIAEASKTGWIYILDRTNGQPLIGIEERPVPQEPRAASAATQPYPIGDALMEQCPTPPLGLGLIGECIFWQSWDTPVFVSPGGNGGVNWANMAYNPQLGYFFATAAFRPRAAVSSGSPVVAAPAIGAKYSGTYTAIDSRTNKIVWQKQMPYSIGQGSGTLATASGLLFHGEPDGNFQAYDARTGDRLWQWQTGAGADAPAITYELDGNQYVAIASGGVSTQTTSANGDMIWAFSLQGSPGGRLQPFAAPPPPPTQIGFTGVDMKTNAVKVADYGYTPTQISVPAGTTVTWTNAGPATHTSTSQAWDTGDIAPGESASVTFDTPGTYVYYCTPHPFMLGQVTVTAGPAT